MIDQCVRYVVWIKNYASKQDILYSMSSGQLATHETYANNQKEKHIKDAKYGWYTYDSKFALPVFGDDGKIERYNVFDGDRFKFCVNAKNRYKICE